MIKKIKFQLQKIEELRYFVMRILISNERKIMKLYKFSKISTKIKFFKR